MPAYHGAHSGSTRQIPEQHSGAHSRGTAAPGHGGMHVYSMDTSSMYGYSKDTSCVKYVYVKPVSTHDLCQNMRCYTRYVVC